MPPNSGPGGAERFIREYEQAYLMELRAGLVASTELALSTRLYQYKDKLPPEVLKYLMALPAYEQPKSLEDMHEAVRKWADIESAGQSWKRKEYVSEFKGRGRGKKGKNKGKDKGKGMQCWTCGEYGHLSRECPYGKGGKGGKVGGKGKDNLKGMGKGGKGKGFGNVYSRTVKYHCSGEGKTGPDTF